MDRIEFAIRRYDLLVPKAVTHLTERTLGPLEIWLTDDVCPVIAEYTRRPAFREHATWVIQ